MEIGLLVFGSLLLILPGIWGIWRGVNPSLFALTGTLLAYLLVNLWESWIRERIGSANDTSMIFAITIVGFLAITVIIGYGGSILFARPSKTSASEPSFSLANTGLGGLVGLLNGALIFSFLLHYAFELGNPDITAAVGSNSILFLAYTWLPWYVLAVGLTLSVWIILRLIIRFIQKVSGRHPAPSSAQTYPEQSTQANRLQGVSSKIDQALRETSRRR